MSGMSPTRADLPTLTSGAGTIRVGAQVGYGVGQIAGQVFRDLPSLLLLFFMTNALGVAPAIAGLAIFVPKLVWGIVCDISVGVLSDRLRNRMARRWWLLLGACGAPIAMILLFHVPAFSTLGKAGYVACAFSFYMLVFASFSVPYLAIAGELSSEPRQRTVLMAWRLVFTAIGVLIAGSLAPVYIQLHGGGQPGFESMSRLLAIICPVSLIVAFFGAGRAMQDANYQVAVPQTKGFPIREALSALTNARFSVLLFGNLVQLAGSGMAYASMLYFLSYNLHRSDAFKQIGLITLIASVSIILAQPAWVFIAGRFGKRPTYVGSSIFYGIVMLLWGLSSDVGIAGSYVCAVLLGLANSGWSLMSFSMVSDLADDGRAGLYSSVWVAADKIGFALGGTLLVGLVLSAFGFDSNRAVAGLSQSSSAIKGVFIAFALAPFLCSLSAAFILARWGVADAGTRHSR